MQTSLLDQNTSMFNSWRDPTPDNTPTAIWFIRGDGQTWSFLPGGQPCTIPDMAICLAGSSENLDQGSLRTGFSSLDSTCKDSAEFKGCYFISGQLILWTAWGLFLGLWCFGETTVNATWDSRALSDFILSITLFKHTYTHFHIICRTNPDVSAAFTVLEPLVPINL